jgi:hypothetical protein
MSALTIILAQVFGSSEAAMEAAMSHPSLVLALMSGFVLLLILLLGEKPHVQPVNEAHRLTPKVNGQSTSGGDLPSIPSAAEEQEKAGENSPAQGIAPVEPPVPRNGAEALLTPLVSQFSQMQQQMFEQFQQTLLMTAQMFGNLQREQMAIIRQELEQIQELTRQLHTLQSQGMRQSRSPLPASPQAVAPSSPTPSLSWKPTTSADKADTPSAKHCNPDVHVWLSQRLSALQEERQSRWQKVLSTLTQK